MFLNFSRHVAPAEGFALSVLFVADLSVSRGSRLPRSFKVSPGNIVDKVRKIGIGSVGRPLLIRQD